jgi:hypothetical protein
MKSFALLLSTLLLAACGGGGAPASAPAAAVASTSTFALKQAYTNDFNDTKTYPFTVSGTVTSGGNTGTVTGNGTVVQSAVASTTFEGAAALVKTKTTSGSITVTVGATSATQALAPSLSGYFVSPTFDLVGYTSSGSYSFAVAPATVPATAKVGDSGTIGTFNSAPTSTKVPVVSTNAISWALGADTASTAILSLTQTIKNTGGVVTATQVDTYRLTPAGAVTPIKAVATLTGTGTLTFSY